MTENTTKPYIPAGKSQIAEAYEMSTNTLRRIMLQHQDIFESQCKGFNKKAKTLTPKQREILRDILGDPIK